jgi:hypothetical protein
LFEVIPIQFFTSLRLLARVVRETESLGKLGFQDADTAKLPAQFQVLAIHLVGEEEKDGGIHEGPVLGRRFPSAPFEMSPEAARAPLRLFILAGKEAERPEEAALWTEGTELSVTGEGEANALQGGVLLKRRDGLNEISRPRLGREADADPRIDLEQAEARDVQAQSLEITRGDEGVWEVDDRQLSCHRFLPLVGGFIPDVLGS